MKNSSDVHHVPKCNTINLTIWLDWSQQYIDPQIDRKCITFLIKNDPISSHASPSLSLYFLSLMHCFISFCFVLGICFVSHLKVFN